MKIIILSILCGILLLISFILLIQNYKLKKDARALIESIDEFTNQGKTMQNAVQDAICHHERNLPEKYEI